MMMGGTILHKFKQPTDVIEAFQCVYASVAVIQLTNRSMRLDDGALDISGTHKVVSTSN